MGNLSLVLDIVLVITSVWMVLVVRKAELGGIMGNTLSLITIGAVLLGLAHMIETAMLDLFNLSVEFTELSHRLIVLSGFVLLILGFRQFAKLRQD
ncbi:MAG: hypothetical protein Q9P01_02605 [Anaerolineae bacterium]|nr:hypothetical protein [Anaerolineae bacterium]MDQ7033747.1 hypothetical protein [Anaerolineae bacterium]